MKHSVGKILLMLLLTCSCTALAMKEEKKVSKEEKQVEKTALKTVNISYTPRSMLIFLDDSIRTEERLAVSKPLSIALRQDAGPILASASLLYAQNEFPVDSEIYNKWIIKEINEALYLLIPLTYPDGMKVDSKAVSAYDPSHISDIELTLGLKVNHLKTVALKDVDRKVRRKLLLSLESKRYAEAAYFMEALFNEKSQESSIFCTRSNYRGKQVAIPTWAFYMNGHGTIKNNYHPGTLVHLTLDDFKKVLDFLERRINTRLLFYNTCYAAGLNAEAIYKDALSAIQKTYSFAIVTQTLTDAPTATRAEADWVTFLKKLNTPHNEIDYREAVMAIINERRKPPSEDEKVILQIQSATPFEHQVLATAPQIKLPGVEWFSVMDSPKNIVQIGSTLAITRDPKKPLDIVTFFKTDPKIILLCIKDVPFELIINAKNIQAIISMIPGDAIHKLKKISSTRYKNTEIMDWFMRIEMLNPLKIFLITAINDTKNVLIYNELCGRGGGPSVERYEKYAFFELKDALYVKEPGKEPTAATEEQQKKYQMLLERVNKKEEVKNIKEKTVYTLGSLEIKQNDPEVKKIAEKLTATVETALTCRIEKIETDIPVNAIASWLGGKLATGAILSIGTITGLGGEIALGRSGDEKAVKPLPDVLLNEKQAITISDLIIDKSGKKTLLYLTYHNTQDKNDRFFIEEDRAEEGLRQLKEISDDYRKRYVERIKALQTAAKKEAWYREQRELSNVTPEKIGKIAIAIGKTPEARKTAAASEFEKARTQWRKSGAGMWQKAGDEKKEAKSAAKALPPAPKQEAEDKPKEAVIPTAQVIKPSRPTHQPSITTPQQPQPMVKQPTPLEPADAKEIKDACVRGDVTEVRRLIESKKIDPNSVVKEHLLGDDHTLLYWAVEQRGYQDKGSLGVAQLLVEKGADVNREVHPSEDVLTHAIFAGKSFELIQFLVERGANVNGRYDDCPLYGAISQRNPNPNIVKLLIDHKVDVNRLSRGKTMLWWAVDSDNIAIVRMLIEAGAKIDPRALEHAEERAKASVEGRAILKLLQSRQR